MDLRNPMFFASDLLYNYMFQCNFFVASYLVSFSKSTIHCTINLIKELNFMEVIIFSSLDVTLLKE